MTKQLRNISSDRASRGKAEKTRRILSFPDPTTRFPNSHPSPIAIESKLCEVRVVLVPVPGLGLGFEIRTNVVPLPLLEHRVRCSVPTAPNSSTRGRQLGIPFLVKPESEPGVAAIQLRHGEDV